MPGKKPAQVFAGDSAINIGAQQAFNGVRNFFRGAAIAHRTSEASVLANGATEAEVISVLDGAVDFDFLAFETDVGDAVLPAAVRATGHVEFELLVEGGQTLIQLFDQPARKRLGLG